MTRRPRPTRGGSIMPLLALCLVALFAFVGLAVDLGMIAVSRTQYQNAADVAALVGARSLNNRDGVTDTNRPAALTAARDVVKTNPRLSGYVADGDIASVVAGQYKYNTSTRRFAVSYPAAVAGGDSWSAVKVALTAGQPTYFMRVFGVQSMPTGATAVAVHRPRDLAFVLDFTGSMTFGSVPHWPYDIDGDNTSVEGLLNPDPAYPQFGHYARYTHYDSSSSATLTSSAAASGTVTSRPNPLQTKTPISNTDGGYAPNNHTMTSTGGPPMVEDFITAAGDPASFNPATATVKNAFKMWSTTQTAAAVTSTLTPATFTWTSYNATTGACPAPDNFATQSDSPVTYVGDKWPRTNGTRGAQGTDWSTRSGNTFTDNGAKTLQEFLGSSTTTAAGRSLSGYTFPTTASGYAHPNSSSTDGGNGNANYRDSVWEAYGYDLNVSDLRGQTGSGKTVRLLDDADKFKGYSMGPGYWGKTFFVWPPDPRWGGGTTGSPNPANPSTTNPVKDANGHWICDWRRRFFLRGDGQALNPQTDNINRILFAGSAGHVLNTIATTVSGSGNTVNNMPGYYRINYAAVIAWLKAGPQTLPTNLRSGRILYYSTMPGDLTTSATGNSLDKMFWREYIHYLLGVGEFSSSAPLRGWDYTPERVMAGVESRFPFGSPSLTATSAFDPSGSPPVNPKPYMAHTDNVNRPRLHFWFGPYSMLHFLRRAGLNRPWWSGTTHEAQCWQLKAAISSVLDDMRKNHPNDYCGIAGFAVRNNFNTPLANMGQDWYTLKNVLFFRKDTVADMKSKIVVGSNPPTSTSTMEHRPYDADFDNQDIAMIPNAAGGTDPNSGLAVAFNMFSANTTYGYGGRKGATKVVIFETDGIPNSTRKWFVTGTADETRYAYNSGSGSNPTRWAGDTSLNNQARYAVEVVKNIVAPVSTTGQSGYSLPNAPARVYAIGFGDVFTGYTGSNYGTMNTTARDALKFLQRVQQVGGTAAAGDPPGVSISADNIITGPYDSRITKLKNTLERIAQSGVQVTLIE